MLSEEDQKTFGCGACGTIGCWTQSPTCLFRGQSRSTHIDANLGPDVPHMSQISVQVFIDGAEYLPPARIHANWQRGRNVCLLYTSDAADE